MSKLPKMVSRAFVDDAVAFTIMFYSGGVANTVHGTELQKAMKIAYPRQWVQWLLNKVGEFSED
jgi:hypothetical protein